MSDPLLVAREISVRLGGRTILDNVGVTLAPQQLVALVGPNGAGKTTLIKALAGLVPCFGKVEIEGRDRAAMKARERAQKLAYLPQGHEFSWPLPAAEIVALGRYPHADPFSPRFIGRPAGGGACARSNGPQGFRQQNRNDTFRRRARTRRARARAGDTGEDRARG